MSYFCGTIENEITARAYKYAYKNGWMAKDNTDWGYDGFTIPANPDPNFVYNIDALNEYVRKETGFKKVRFIEKPFKEDDYLPLVIEQRRNMVVATSVAEPLSVEAVAVEASIEVVATTIQHPVGAIESDTDAIEMTLPYLKPFLKYCRGQFFLKRSNVWTNDQNYIECWLITYYMTCDLYHTTEKGKYKAYSKNVAGAKHLVKALTSYIITKHLEEEDLYGLFHSTTTNRLCFLDGMLDFEKRKFYTWEDIQTEGIQYFTCVQIKRNFKQHFDNPNEEIITKIKDKILGELFREKDLDTALKYLARQIAGCVEDKQWSLYLGERNCGKGVFEALFKHSLQDYYQTFSTENLITRKANYDAERELIWTMNFQFARLAVSQEADVKAQLKKEYNGVLLKRICSGGDPIKARRLNENPVEFNVQTGIMIMANDCPAFDPKDTYTMCHQFNNNVQFKTQAEIDQETADGVHPNILATYRLADADLKTNVKTDEYADALIMLLYKNWQDKKPLIRKDAEEKEDDNKQDLRKFIATNFTIDVSEEGLANNFISNDDINHILVANGFGNVSDKKRSIILKTFNLEGGKKSGKRGWKGIKKNEPKPVLDADGNQLLDADGNPVFEGDD